MVAVGYRAAAALSWRNGFRYVVYFFKIGRINGSRVCWLLGWDEARAPINYKEVPGSGYDGKGEAIILVKIRLKEEMHSKGNIASPVWERAERVSFEGVRKKAQLVQFICYRYTCFFLYNFLRVRPNSTQLLDQ
jgi:hypothetical protein